MAEPFDPKDPGKGRDASGKAVAQDDAAATKTKILQDQLRLQKELNAAREVGAEIEERTVKQLVKAKEIKTGEKEMSSSRHADLTAEIQMLAEINEGEENRQIKKMRYKEIEDLTAKQKEIQLALDEKSLKTMVKNNQTGTEKYRTLKKGVIERRKEYKLTTLQNKQREEGGKHQADLVRNIAGGVLQQSKMGRGLMKGVGGIIKMRKGAQGLSTALKTGAVSMSMLVAATGVGILLLMVGAIFKLVEWMLKLAVQTRDATVAFQRATGAAKEFGAAIPALEHDMRAVGVSMEEAAAAQNALYTSTTDYTMASAGARKDLLKTTALMGEFGVSVETSAKIAQAATKGLGIGIGGADELLLGLSAHASDIGVPINKMMEDFAAASDQLKRFGSDGERVFKRLAMVQKITGMEMGRILSITEKFDTFEGAAKQAGQLNAALGGNFVNAMDLMMETDPVERFNMLRDSIMNSAGSFDDMSYYQKKFYANSLGLKDVGELAAMMSGDFDALDGSIGKTSADYATQREKAKNWQSTMEILKNTLATLAPTFSKVAEKIDEMVNEFSKGEGPLKRIGDIFGKYMSDEYLLPLLESMPGKIESVVKGLERFAKNADKVVEMIESMIIVGKIIGAILIGVAVGFALATFPISATAAAIAGVVAGLLSLWAMFHKSGSDSLAQMLGLDGESTLAKGLNVIQRGFNKLKGGITSIMGWFKKMGETIRGAFDFQWVKDSMNWLGSFLPGEMGKTTQGIRDEMGIASDSKVMTKINQQTYVGPMKSVAAQMPGLVKDVYADVPKVAAKELEPLTGVPQKVAGNVIKDTSLIGTLKAFSDAVGITQAAQPAAAGGGAAGGGSTSTTVNIPIHIGKDALGTVVGEIVDGKLGAVSFKGATGIGGL